jgi:hypothetical protein
MSAFDRHRDPHLKVRRGNTHELIEVHDPAPDFRWT